MKLKVLVNTSTLVIGGGIQVGVSFIEYIFRHPAAGFEFFFLVSDGIYKNLSNQIKSNDCVELISISPAKILTGKASRKRISKIEASFNPDIVYSLGFPSYVEFKNLEIGRYTNPWEIFPAKEAWKLLSKREKIPMYLKLKYRIFWAKKADYFETQTEAAKSAIASKLSINTKRVKVIPNSVNNAFLEKPYIHPKIDKNSVFGIFCLAAPHIHKNLNCIPEVAIELSKLKTNQQFVFILTLPEDSEMWIKIQQKAKVLGVTNFIQNLGVLKLKDCIEHYESSNMVFLPTLLEVFSATYLEAMIMQKPIVTSDLDFAREICGRAAIYIKPNNYGCIAKDICFLMNDESLQKQLTAEGLKQFKQFPSGNQKYELLLIWFKEIYNQSINSK